MLTHIVPDPSPACELGPLHNWFKELDAPPPVDGGTWGLLIASDGHPQIRWQCPVCGALSSQSLSRRRAWEFGLDPDDLPVLDDRQAAQR